MHAARYLSPRRGSEAKLATFHRTRKPRNLCNYEFASGIWKEGDARVHESEEKAGRRKGIVRSVRAASDSTVSFDAAKLKLVRGLEVRGNRRGGGASIEWEEPIHANERKRREERDVRSNRGGLMGWPRKIRNKRNVQVESFSLIPALRQRHTCKERIRSRKVDPAKSLLSHFTLLPSF